MYSMDYAEVPEIASKNIHMWVDQGWNNPP